MENGLKGLLISAGVIITCIVISLATMLAHQAQQVGINFINQNTKLTKEFQNDFDTDNELIFTGSELINFIKKYQNNFNIVVFNSKCTTTYSSANLFVKNNPLREQYIKPTDIFKGLCSKDSNDAIQKITFQKKS